jgi:CTP:molybdopterin cytidylyltransferase MocA
VPAAPAAASIACAAEEPAAMIGGVLLAAGEGRRFRRAGGGVKLLATVAGRPLVEAPLRALAEAGLDELVVVLGAAAEEVASEADLRAARTVVNRRWRDGMATSLQAGLRALDPACGWALVALGDAPGLTAEAVRRVRAATATTQASLLAARYRDGRLAHPVAIRRDRWPQLPTRGEAGARVLGEPEGVDCADLEPPGDADTPADL